MRQALANARRLKVTHWRTWQHCHWASRRLDTREFEQDDPARNIRD